MHLDMMESKVFCGFYQSRVCHYFSDFCDAKMSVNDSFSFGPKIIQKPFVLLLRKSSFPMGIVFSALVPKSVPAFILWNVGGGGGEEMQDVFGGALHFAIYHVPS